MVGYKPGYLRKRSEDIINARNWAIGLIFGAIGLGWFAREAQRIYSLPFDVLNFASLALCILTGLLIFLWIWATQRELNWLFQWLDPERYEPPTNLKETAIILGLGVLLVGLVFASQNPLLYGCIFTAYSLANIFSVRYLNSELKKVFAKSINRINEETNDAKLLEKNKTYLTGIEILEFYFIKRPQIRRLIFILIFSLFGLALSIYWQIKKIPLLGIGAYFIFFFTILVSEIVIYRWRNIRDNELKPLVVELGELARENDVNPL